MREGARAEHIKLTTHFPEKIIIRYPVFVRVFTFFLKTNVIIERFVESSPNPTKTYFKKQNEKVHFGTRSVTDEPQLRTTNDKQRSDSFSS